MPLSSMIPCGSCGRDIARKAATCPNCGAQNDYVDPRLTEFITTVAQFNVPEIQYQTTSCTLQGSVVQRPLDWRRFSAVGVVLIAAGYLTGVTLLWNVGLLLQLVVLGYMMFRRTEPRQFQVDFSQETPEWWSNDDNYWAKVKSALFETTHRTA